MRSSRVTPSTVGTPNEWNALHEDGRAASRLLAHQMYGTIALPTNATNGQTFTATINGNAIVLTAVASISGAAAGSFLIAGTAALTLANAIALLQNPTISSANQVALGTNTSANVTLVNYVNWSVSGTNLIASGSNFSLYSPVTSFSASTTISSGSYTANTMALYVEAGVVYVNGTEVYFTGGITPTVTAPVSHPRIDVLTIDNTGTLNWTTGTEASSPSTPTYPVNQIPICELYNVTGETALYDNSNQQSGQGYILNDVRPFLAYPIPLGAVPDSILPSANDTYNLGSSSFQWNNGYFGNAVFVNGTAMAGHYGGTGADGALSITSGTTTLSASSASLILKNYASISITGTGTLAGGSPATTGTLAILKSQTNVTLTSSSTPMLNFAAMGAAGGAQVTGSNTNGDVGANGGVVLIATNGGTAPASGGAAGTGGAAPSNISVPTAYVFALMKYPLAFVGGGGSSGATDNGAPTNSGAGGTGGGGLIIECGGSFNFTTASGISVAGANGSNAVEPGSAVGGGGGGGGGGFCFISYASLTANTGTITVSGGTGGNSGAASSGQTRSGGAGGGALTAGSSGTTTTSASTKCGGNGATGYSLVVANTEYS